MLEGELTKQINQQMDTSSSAGEEGQDPESGVGSSEGRPMTPAEEAEIEQPREVIHTSSLIDEYADVRPPLRKSWWCLGGKTELPPSVPKGWGSGNVSARDRASMAENRVVQLNEPQHYSFTRNFVKTSRFELYNFLPLFLWEEFNPKYKIANVYFLFISALQMVPSITNTFGVPLMLLPLLFVVCVDAVFMIIEDVARHKADRAANSSPTYIYNAALNTFEEAPWSDIHVGDLIKIKNRQPIPCDVLLLGVDEPHPERPAGVCYVETKSLDGETNLKIRGVVKGLVGAICKPEDVGHLTGRVIMEHPNKLINNFNGTVRHGKKEEADREGGAGQSASSGFISEPIDPDGVLLRGCVLRNSHWVVGLVLNTGEDTKIMMSMAEAPSKESNLSGRINTEIKRVAGLMMAMCVVGAIGAGIWDSQNQGDAWYLGDYETGGSAFFVTLFYYVLLLNGFIPISLYVSMNFVRFFQAYFMNMDLDMYHEDTDTPARVRTMNLNEDLGQITHVFSDKTGTLTCNVMDFRKCCVGGVSYGRGTTEIGKAAMLINGEQVPEEVMQADLLAKNVSRPHVNFYDPSIYEDINGRGPGGEDQAAALHGFFTALAVCHTVIPEKYETGEVMLSASSPDDEALVLGAKYFGVEFMDRIDTSAILRRAKEVKPPAPKSQSVGGGHRGSRDEDKTPINSPGRGGAGNSAHSPSPADVQVMAERAKVKNDELWADSIREEFTVLHVFGFNSDRKRMSVICRCPDGKVRVYCKGADTVMIPRLRSSTAQASDEEKKKAKTTVQYMDEYAKEGLRTLVVTQSVVEEERYRDWASRYAKASSDIKEIQKKNAGQENEIEKLQAEMEIDLTLLGSSAIEDKLQDGVPMCISDLLAAGVKVWVLTGDKEETAINIGVACQLIWAEEHMDRTVINLHSDGVGEAEDTAAAIEEILVRKYNEAMGLVSESSAHPTDDKSVSPARPNNKGSVSVSPVTGGGARKKADGSMLPRTLVMDGPALHEATTSASCMAALLAYAQLCHSVVCCRVTPDQKRAMVQMVRHNIPGARTLSIGDGANDVPMIQGAHVGVGISGQEGMQAVNASDYAVAQFRFLEKLMLVHGRWNYRRSSRVVCYLFYKNVLMSAALFVYAFWNGVSGVLFYEYSTTNLYAVMYTCVPILLLGIYDRDISKENCLRNPQLYGKGMGDTWMQPKVFWSWMYQAIFEAIVVTVVPLYFMSGGVRTDGLVTSLLDVGTLCFGLEVVLVNNKMIWMQYRWNAIHILMVSLSSASFFLTTWMVNTSVTINYDFYGIFDKLIANPNFWLTFALCNVIIMIRDLTWKFNHRWFHPALNNVIMEGEANGMTPNDIEDLINATAMASQKKKKKKKGSRGDDGAGDAIGVGGDLESGVIVDGEVRPADGLRPMSGKIKGPLLPHAGEETEGPDVSSSQPGVDDPNADVRPVRLTPMQRMARRQVTMMKGYKRGLRSLRARATGASHLDGDDDGQPAEGQGTMAFGGASEHKDSEASTEAASKKKGGIAAAGRRRPSLKNAGNRASIRGYAFSCDRRAQEAEIDMIMGVREGPLTHSPYARPQGSGSTGFGAIKEKSSRSRSKSPPPSSHLRVQSEELEDGDML